MWAWVETCEEGKNLGDFEQGGLPKGCRVHLLEYETEILRQEIQVNLTQLCRRKYFHLSHEV